MKHSMIFLLGVFFFDTVYAENINLNFYVDGILTQTNVSSCSIGSEFTLPTAPSKRGYNFVGWAEFFNRGTFANWNAVPNTTTSYLVDIHGSQTPQQYDYIIINDASGVPKLGTKIVIEVYAQNYNATWQSTGGYCHTYMNGTDWECDNNQTNYTNPTDGNLTIESAVWGVYANRFSSPTKSVLYNGTIYSPGTVFLQLSKRSESNGTYIAYLIDGFPYSGKWMCRYKGVWSEENKSGWIPEKQIND